MLGTRGIRAARASCEGETRMLNKRTIRETSEEQERLAREEQKRLVREK
jgi:hypothetical protein